MAQARTAVATRLERRDAGLLDLLRHVVYADPRNPYHRLLRLIGCELGDAERLFAAEGVEGALRTLLGQGVYLSVAEFKGRTPIVRGSSTFSAPHHLLANPLASASYRTATSGSRDRPTPTPFALAYMREAGLSFGVSMAARGGADWLKGVWDVPGGAALNKLVRQSTVGAPPVAWFSQVNPAAPGLHPRYRWTARAIYLGGLLAGVPMPAVKWVPLAEPLPVARWMAGVLQSGRTPFLETTSSSAVRVCLAALEAGIDLQGARFRVGGEPITQVRLDLIHSTGAIASPSYGSIEANILSDGCTRPAHPDDVHLMRDLFAVVQPQAAASGPAPLYVSSLNRLNPLVLLNVSLGDQAVVSERPCGCPLAEVGWTTHLHDIRSLEKLTAAGMTFLDADLVRVLEVDLPRQFGGQPTDYQLVEKEGADGRPMLYLRVHPSLGPRDEEAIRLAFLAAIAQGPGAERVMSAVWRDAQLPRVQRLVPEWTLGGKILHLHQSR